MSKKYIHYGHTKFDKELFAPIVNRMVFVKPLGGFWASPVDAKFGWKDWNYGERFRECKEENSLTFTLAEGARVLYIDNRSVLNNLPQLKSEYALPDWVSLDFEKLAEEYDAIELDMSADSRLYWALYGWDCDSILIMNPDVVVEET